MSEIPLSIPTSLEGADLAGFVEGIRDAVDVQRLPRQGARQHSPHFHSADLHRKHAKRLHHVCVKYTHVAKVDETGAPGSTTVD